jgi:hypothetical protein
MSRQFEVSQPMKREEDITPLLSKEEEEILEQAEKSLTEAEPISFEPMTDIKAIPSIDTTFKDKLISQGEDFICIPSLDPIRYGTRLKDLIGTIETVCLFITLSS